MVCRLFAKPLDFQMISEEVGSILALIILFKNIKNMKRFYDRVTAYAPILLQYRLNF